MPVARHLAAILTLVCLAAPALGQRVKVGEPFPEFTATNRLDGKRFKLADYQGKIVLIDFWATWCGPCVRELPNVKTAYQKYAHEGFEIISISLDSDMKRLDDFVKSRRMTWPQVAEGGGWKTRLAKQYGISSIPQTFLIDREGVCIGTALRGRQLEKAVGRAVERSPAPAVAPTASTPTLSAADVESLRVRVQETRAALESAAEPFAAEEEGLEKIESGIETIGSMLPRPADRAAFERAYGTMRDQLVQTRAAMFSQGSLNRLVVVIPPDAFAAGNEDSQGPVIGVRRQLAAFRQALASLNLALSPVATAQRDAVLNLRKIEQGLDFGRGDRAAMAASLETLEREAEQRRWNGLAGWRQQLATLDGKAAKVMGDPNAWAEFKPLVKGLQEAMAAAGDDPAELAVVHEDFVALCTDMLARRDIRAQRSTGLSGR